MRILVLDDNETWYETLNERIGHCRPGASIDYIWVTSAERALDVAKNERVDIIFSDINLTPGADRQGLELFVKPLLKERYAKPVICMSSIDDCKRECFSAGAKAFWDKGNLAQLDEIIEKYVPK